ncbi:MAG TPA: ABC transporter permease [Thermotogota bacterium]|jgi:peptide/nickel transport system permease protein|nr:ABC transporter permease [Thermotogota bacterium]NLH19047.1 ABC transporter permease [Thermotogaceae bacterium]OQC30800.1 MAG: Nickel transport system permease protein NikB [Thermotogota bacterium ADurb.Bin062]HNW47475.1 ABC transporter permease [Thermotogota bacterium]HNY81444.1 ABC transporter permease [Thermotogota bacterium]
MISFIIRRFLIMIPMMILISMICFFIIELQPGDYVSTLLENPRISGNMINELRAQLGLDKPGVVRYWLWIKGIVTKGDFGYSFAHNRPVGDLIWERMGWTVVLALTTIVFQWAIGIPLGIFSARHPYSFMDYLLTFLAFLGLSIPEFFLALILIYWMLSMGASSIGGLFSAQYVGAPWSFAKIIDLFQHIWLPIVVVGIGGFGGLMRVMRGNTLDTLGSPFVSALRARGLSEKTVRKHAIKNALNPMVSIAGMELPNVFSGTIIVAIVLGVPTMGPFFYDALLSHDDYLIMAFLMFIAFITQIGNLLADFVLAFIDPRIRMS